MVSYGIIFKNKKGGLLVKTLVSYKDLSKYRNGRMQSKIVKTWLEWYRENAIMEIKQNFDYLLKENTAEIAMFVLDAVVVWLNSKEGKKFIAQVFDIHSIEVEEKVYFKIWAEEYENTFISNILFRHGANDMTDDEWETIHCGNEMTAYTVADTFVGWLNSYVGRSFMKEALGLEIAVNAEDGSE